jgi:hypothetical protein
MICSKMKFDTPEYLKTLRQYRKVMGFQTLREAEEDLFPIRAHKRRLKIIERLELENTIGRKRK